MKAQDMTHYSVWKATGVAQSSLNDWRAGRGVPGVRNLERLADYFGVTVDYLIGREQKEKPTPKTGRELDERDKKFMEMLLKLTPEQKESLFALIQSLLNNQK